MFSTSYAWGGYGCPAGALLVDPMICLKGLNLNLGSSIVFTVTDYHGNGASTAPVIVSDSCECGSPSYILQIAVLTHTQPSQRTRAALVLARNASCYSMITASQTRTTGFFTNVL